MLTKNLHGLGLNYNYIKVALIKQEKFRFNYLFMVFNRKKIYEITHIRVSFIIVVSPNCTNGSTTIRQFMMKTHIVCNMYYLGRKICKTIWWVNHSFTKFIRNSLEQEIVQSKNSCNLRWFKKFDISKFESQRIYPCFDPMVPSFVYKIH